MYFNSSLCVFSKNSNTYTEKILTFSSKLKNVLKNKLNFQVENVFILLESSGIGGTNKLLVQSLEYTYQKVVK